jgi:hypothetical protein
MGIAAFPFFLLLNTAVPGLHHPRHGADRHPARDAVRPAVLLHRGELPDRAGLRRQRLGYQAASLIAGGPAPLLATWMLPTFGWQAIAVYIIACVVITLAAAALLPDRSKADVAPMPELVSAGRTAGG